MAHRLKRKFDTYEQNNTPSPAAMPRTTTAGPSGNTNTTTNYYDNRYDPIRPTPELQELYNTWRREEELAALNAHLNLESQAQLSAGSSDGGQHLRPPSLSAASMSRSPSCASTSNSVTRGLDNIDLGEDRTTRRRQGRQGPLDARGKARAALVRKLSACTNCRSRKVKCQHHNFRLLEDAYQRSKQPAPRMTQRVRHNNTGGISARDNDLLGVGVGQLYPQFQPSYDQFDGSQSAHDDLDRLLDQVSPVSPRNTAPLYNFLQGPRMEVLPSNNMGNHTNITAASTAWPSYPYSISFSPFMSTITAPPATRPQTAATDPVGYHVPIGRRISRAEQSQGYDYLGGEYPSHQYEGGDGQWEWECRYSDNETSSSYSYLSESNEAPPICKQRYGTLQNLETHFQNDHLPFENGQFFPYCKRHEVHYLYDLVCPSCQNENDATAGTEGAWFSPTAPTAAAASASNSEFQEQWYWGDIIPTPDRVDGQRGSGRVLSEDGEFRTGGPHGPPARSGTITQLDVWNNAYYGVGGSYGGGGGYSAAAHGGGGGGRRGNSTFPGDGDYYSSLSAQDYPAMSMGSSAAEGGSNNAHSYGDTYVNLVLSPPPPPFLEKTMSLSPLSSKMMLSPFIFPLPTETDCQTTDMLDDSPCCPSAGAGLISKTSARVATRGRAGSLCPYYAISRELIGSRKSRSLTRGVTAARSRSLGSVSASLRWPSSGSCTSTIFGHPPSFNPAGINITSGKLTLVLLLLLAIVLVSTGPSSSFTATATAAKQALPWNNNKDSMLLWFPSPLWPGKTISTHQTAVNSSIICVLVGLVGMWLMKRTRFQLALVSARKDELRSQRQLYQSEQKDLFVGNVDHPVTEEERVYSHVHHHHHRHAQASAAAAG